MAGDAEKIREDAATVARAFCRLGYVHAFGHVSVRIANSIWITPTRPPLGAVRGADLIQVDWEGEVVSGDAVARPIEVFLHVGIYRARADVGAICRTHAPFASVWPPKGEVPAIQHGFGGIAGDIQTYDGCDLIHSRELGAAAAAQLGTANGLILRGNGVVTIGWTLSEAAARMWALEERCAQAWRQGNHPAAFSMEDLAARARWYPAESERIWTWIQYLGSGEPAAKGVGS
jgi:HCOMODA/2-hydroxy-3-carboxy-muconic semialdehyde decarboxylase